MRASDYLEEFESVKKYKARLAPTTARNAMYTLHYFMDWVKEGSSKFAKMDPDQLVEHQKAAGNGEQYEILDEVQSYILSLKGRHSTKKNKYNTIRGFFKANRAPLPLEDFNIRGDVPKVQGVLTVTDIKNIVLSSKAVYRAIWLCMFQGGMGQDELVYWSDNGLRKLVKDLKATPEYVRVDLPGRKGAKNEKPYYTIIIGDSLDALREWMKVRPDKKKNRDEPTTSIFVNQFGEPITKKATYTYWLRHLRDLGLMEKPKDANSSTRYGRNPHEIRDVFRSMWEKSPAKGSVAEYMMGHKVDPLEYNKAFRDEDWVRKEYMKALPMLQVMSSGRPFGQVNLDEVEAVRSENALLQAQVDRLESRLDRFGTPRALIEMLREHGLVATLEENEEKSGA